MNILRLSAEKHPVALKLWRFLVIAKNRRYHRVACWVQKSLTFVREMSLAEITFSQEGAWVRDDTGAEFAYIAELLGGIHGMEFHVQYEKNSLGFLIHNLKPNCVMLDIGANVGFFSIRVARSVPGAQIFAFEPVSLTFSYLRKNIVRNGLSKSIEAFQLAVGNNTEKVPITTDFGSANYLLPSTHISGGLGVEWAGCTTIDNFVTQRGLKRLDVIKCDVEGAELFVINGARKTLEALRPPLIMLEVHKNLMRRNECEPATLFTILQDCGYQCAHFSDHGLQRVCSDLAATLQESRHYLFYTEKSGIDVQ